MEKSIYKTIRTIYALFMFIFMLCALCFWATHSLIIDEEQHYVFSKITHDPYLSVVSGYLITYGIMSLVFSILFIILWRSDKWQENQTYQYFKIFCILFLVGLLLYITAWYYWDIGKSLSGVHLLFKMCSSYVIDLVVVYLRGIMLWFAATIATTFFFVRAGLASDKLQEDK